MKKRSLVIGGIVLVCLAGGGLVLTNVLESRTEQQVRDALTMTSASAESVRYSLWQNQLDVNGIQVELEFLGQKMKGRVESVSLAGFDPDCLNPDAQGLPRVAETLVITGVKWETTGDPKSAISSSMTSMTSTMQEARVEDWYQNLGRLLAQKWTSEAFWTETYRYKLAMLSAKNYTTTVSVNGSPNPLTEHIAMFGLLGPVNGEGAGDNLAGRTLSFFANDISIDMPTMATVTLKRTEMRDVVMPAPADMVAIMDLNQKMQEKPDDTQIAMQFLERMGKAYEKQSPCRTLLLQDLAIKAETPDAPAIRVQEFEQTLETGVSARFGMRVTGLNVAVTKEQLAEFAPVDAFLPKAESEGLTTDAAFMLALSPESVGLSRLDWSTNALGLADAKGSVDFALSVSSLTDLFLPSVSVDKVFKFKETTLNYQDKGLIAAAVAAYGKEAGISAQAAQQILLAQVPSAVGPLGAQGQPLADAMTLMLENPGTLTASLSFAKAILFEQALLALLLEPQSVTLKAQAEPGKPFADWLPASLK